jgi:hypothetical protein
VPYICKLTFNAPGDNLGDIVQVRFVCILHELTGRANYQSASNLRRASLFIADEGAISPATIEKNAPREFTIN